MNYRWLLIFLLIIACDHKKPLSLQELQIKNLSVTVPVQIKFVERQSYDSYVAYLITAQNDTFHVEYGKRGIINSLYERSPHVFSHEQREQLIRNSNGHIPTDDEALFSDYPEEDESQRI